MTMVLSSPPGDLDPHTELCEDERHAIGAHDVGAVEQSEVQLWTAGISCVAALTRWSACDDLAADLHVDAIQPQVGVDCVDVGPDAHDDIVAAKVLWCPISRPRSEWEDVLTDQFDGWVEGGQLHNRDRRLVRGTPGAAVAVGLRLSNA